ncbi:isocitrate lyase/PEP mutase family protein [Kineosporia succinea]|uniref:Methylisocitrate lyase n=1 Tax=Kineosporia succinea TaxID=84632 RepID=A0ABT9PCV2_9ACTN|nr:isocitrate lyase/phosphoenolpyruvate mutase family protein [Kineosporia succinea]MDP9830312.1 methylisocitrate lyase [Kineosporia succinea]
MNLRQLISESDGPLVVPGVGTALEARAAQAAGFGAVYVSGYATAAWRHAVPDIGLIALAEIEASLRAVVAATGLPVLVDADTGYGDVSNVVDTVRKLEAAGASGIQIEDQTWPKRCGHLVGKTVEPADRAALKIRAAAAARTEPETLIVARTDARATDGLDEAVRRARMFHDEGADVLFIDAPESAEEVARIAAEVPGMRLINVSESGRTPTIPLEEFARLGIEIVLYPTSALRIASRAFADFFADLRAQGDSQAWTRRMHALDDLNSLVGLDEIQHLEGQIMAGPTRSPLSS